MPITMTSAAEDHVLKSLQNRKKGIGVRLGVKTTGCSGLAYVLEFVDAAALDDEVFDFDSFKVLIDKFKLNGAPIVFTYISELSNNIIFLLSNLFV